ncbi:MAG: hypothetical protein O3A95_06700 [Planctomycetota bacterium]|nr:hypothetical protein [Planctomycetota bacterium]MDA1113971.1 hypothetical protein [Planctomycetota bacterium]
MNQATSIFGAIYRRKHVVLLVMAGSIGVGLYQSAVNPPDFVATSEIMIPADALRLSIGTEEGNIPEDPLLPLQEEGRLIGITSLLRSRSVVIRAAEMLPGMDAQRLKTNIRGDVSKDGVVAYYGYGRTAEEATQIANASVKAFAFVLEEMSDLGMRENLKTFKANEGNAHLRAKETADAISAYLVSLETADIGTDMENWLTERSDIQQKLFELNSQSQQFQAQRPIVETTLQGRPEFVVSRQELSLPGNYTNSLARVATLSTELALTRLKFTDAHPEVLRIQTELDLVRVQAAQNADLVLSASTMMQDKMVASLSQKLVDIDIFEAGFTSQRDIYQARKLELDTLLAEVPGYRQRLTALQMEHNQARSMADKITSRREELEFHLEHGLQFSVIDPYAQAVAERAKQIPTPTGIMMFTSFAGLLLGIFVALLTATFSRMRATRPY